jgi:uncharacterized protein
MKTVYHAGELAVQERAGVAEMARRVGNGIHSEIPPTAEEFLQQQPLVIVGSVASSGAVWVSVLSGRPGFITVLDSQTIRIGAIPHSGDPLAQILSASAVNPHVASEVGILAIEPKTRRRMRLNGTARTLPDNTLQIHAREVYANCPKYIQARSIEVAPADEYQPLEVHPSETLTAQQQEWIARSDTFFIASAAPNGGADASHRGGNPGFVRLINDRTLIFPDYSGNMMFNTLGNIAANPHAGLLFLDFQNGDTLQLTGEAKIHWEPEQAAAFPGAERVVEFHAAQIVHITHAVPLRFQFLDYSRFNPA